MQKLLTWIDERFPLTKMFEEHLSKYYAPKNFNFWYFFGSLALLVLVIQIVTGIFLTMHYKPDAANAFASVEYIMRDVPYGWLIRYMHSTGATAFFVVVYLHMFRGLMYGSYKQPRELIWLFGLPDQIWNRGTGRKNHLSSLRPDPHLTWRVCTWGNNPDGCRFQLIPTPLAYVND